MDRLTKLILDARERQEYDMHGRRKRCFYFGDVALLRLTKFDLHGTVELLPRINQMIRGGHRLAPVLDYTYDSYPGFEFCNQTLQSQEFYSFLLMERSQGYTLKDELGTKTHAATATQPTEQIAAAYLDTVQSFNRRLRDAAEVPQAEIDRAVGTFRELILNDTTRIGYDWQGSNIILNPAKHCTFIDHSYKEIVVDEPSPTEQVLNEFCGERQVTANIKLCGEQNGKQIYLHDLGYARAWCDEHDKLTDKILGKLKKPLFENGFSPREFDAYIDGAQLSDGHKVHGLADWSRLYRAKIKSQDEICAQIDAAKKQLQ